MRGKKSSKKENKYENSNFYNIHEICENNRIRNNSRNNSGINPSFFELENKTRSGSKSEGKNQKDLEIFKKLKYKTFLCKKCKCIPEIKFWENNTLFLNCRCTIKVNIKSKDFIEDYSTDPNHLISLNENMYCVIHKKKFKYYCIDCCINLCEDCANQKEHENHKATFENLLIREKEIKEIKTTIKELKKELQNGDVENRQNLNIIKTLINHINDFPCHNQYNNIIEAKKYFSYLKSNILKPIEMIKINKIDEFNNNIKYHKISSIKIENSELLNFPPILKKYNLKHLEEFKWTNGKISSLDEILIQDFEKLKTLDLEYNDLKNEVLKLNPEHFKKLEFLNLYDNKINSIKIFELASKFENLQKLYLGHNAFDKKEIDTFKKKINLSKIKEFGVTTGCFTDSTIKFLKKIKFKDLEILYVSRNKLKSLSFLKKMKLKKLIEFWSIGNCLTNINQLYYIKERKTLEKINLKNNNITNINGLLEIINNFPKLKELNLEGNNIDKKKYKDIIEKARKKIKLILS